MLNKYIKLLLSLSFALLFAVQFSFSSNIYAQSYQQVDDKPGGDTSTNTTTSSSSNKNLSTYLFIAAGATIVGFFVYKFFIAKPDVQKETPDSTSNNTSMIINQSKSNVINLESEILKTRDKMPFDIFVGLKQDAITNSQKTFIMGISFKL